MTYPILTPSEFAAQGTTPAGVLSIAAYQNALGNTGEATKLRHAAFELSRMVGMPIRQKRRVAANRNTANPAGKRRAA